MTFSPPAGADRPGWLEGLNDHQRQAVDHDGGPLLILAGAGTGKTRTLICRLARLLDRGVAPERILLVTFSRRAADEMVRRAGTLIDPAHARRVEAGTFHAVAHRLLRRYGTAVGLGEDWSVLDAGDAAELMSLVRRDALEAGAGAAPRRRAPRPDTLLAIYSRVVNAGQPLDRVLRQAFPWCIEDAGLIAEVFGGYTARKRAGGLLDFDDLLLFWRAAVQDPALGPALAARYDHVLVDEYQDTNVVQADILRALRAADPRVTVVGDDAQAIYSFRAASVDNLLDFPEHFPGATVVALEQNYRSTRPILALANAVAAGLTSGFPKQLWSAEPAGAHPELATCADEGAQAEAVCEVVLDHLERGMALREQAVLFRAAHHSDLLEVELRHRRIPFVKYGGLRFLEAAHVRDLVALLRLLDNPWDELAWQRVLRLLDGVGPATGRRLLEELGVRDRHPDRADPLTRFVGPDRPALPRAEPALSGLAGALADCRSAGLAPGAQVDRLRAAIDPVVRRRYDHADARLRDLDQMGRLAGASPTRAQLVADLTLDPPVSTGDLAGPPSRDDDYLVLSTVHSAKGGEWRAVHVIHAADGSFPSDMATGTAEGVDEERRLFYVALTRAREHLHLYAPLRYHHSGGRGDRHSYAQRTRFLPPEVEGLLDFRAVRTAPADRGGALPAADLAAAVDGTLQSLW